MRRVSDSSFLVLTEMVCNNKMCGFPSFIEQRYMKLNISCILLLTVYARRVSDWIHTDWEKKILARIKTKTKQFATSPDLSFEISE